MTEGRDFHFACVIAAAGKGERFGGPKADAVLADGKRFLEAIVETARAAGAVEIVTVVPHGTERAGETERVVNPRPSSEQIDSVRLGLARLANTHAAGALLWPVDHPFVTEQTVRALVDAARRSDAEIAIPVHAGRRGHPSFFARGVWRELMTVSDGGARTVVHADPRRVLEVAVDDAGVTADIDTRGEFDAALAGRST